MFVKVVINNDDVKHRIRIENRYCDTSINNKQYWSILGGIALHTKAEFTRCRLGNDHNYLHEILW